MNVEQLSINRPLSFPQNSGKEQVQEKKVDGQRVVNDNKNLNNDAINDKSENITLGEQKLIEAIEKANKALQGVNTRFQFSIHEGTHQIMVKVLNNETGEVIREIPPEKILDMIAKMWELAGLFVDERR